MDNCQKKQNPVNLLFVQPGDYREAFHRLHAGGAETYYAQQHTVDYVGMLARRIGRVGVLSHADQPYAELLPNGVMCYGLNKAKAGPQEAMAVIKAFNPTHVVLRTPILLLLDWALAHHVRMLPLFAQSFVAGNAFMRGYYTQLAVRLNNQHIRWVANHNVPAALSLADLGVAPEKIIPYDFKVTGKRTPDFYSPRQLDQTRQSFKLIFVGSLLPEKGLPECIACLKWLKDNGVDATLTLAGQGNPEPFETLAGSLGVASAVTFKGVIPNAEVIPLIREHDTMIVPSRHEYPEGLPLTLFEALCARTPVIVSDHPMLRARIRHGETGLVFRAGDAAHLGQQVVALRSDPTLYARLSGATRQAWQQLQCPVEWSRLIDIFISGTPEDEAWLASHAVTDQMVVGPPAANAR